MQPPYYGLPAWLVFIGWKNEAVGRVVAISTFLRDKQTFLLTPVGYYCFASWNEQTIRGYPPKITFKYAWNLIVPNCNAFFS